MRSLEENLKDFIQEVKRFWGFMQWKKQFKFAWFIIKKLSVFVWKWKREIYFIFCITASLLIMFQIGYSIGHRNGVAYSKKDSQLNEQEFINSIKKSIEVSDIAINMLIEDKKFFENDCLDTIKMWKDEADRNYLMYWGLKNNIESNEPQESQED